MFFKQDSGKPEQPSRRTLPALPLRDIIVFPHMSSRLFVGREKSIAALEEAMGRDKEIFLAAQKNAKTNDPTPEDIYLSGTIGVIVQLLRLADGTVKVLVEGRKRARVKRFHETRDYFLVEVEEFPDENTDDAEVELVEDGLVHDAERRGAVDGEPEHHRELAVLRDELLGAVERIDHPYPLLRQPVPRVGGLFGEPAVGGKRAEDVLLDAGVGLEVGGGDGIVVALLAHLDRAVVVSGDDLAGGAGGFHGHLALAGERRRHGGGSYHLEGSVETAGTWTCAAIRRLS